MTPPAGGVREAECLMRQLGVAAAQCVEKAYVDLLAEDARSDTAGVCCMDP